MGANPLLGVVFHWLGGLASGSFYVPYRSSASWSWETYWLDRRHFSVGSSLRGSSAPYDQRPAGGPQRGAASTSFWTYFFGVLWGLGGLTFGLTMRYLGMSLGMAVALGYTAAFGTLMPPIFRGELFSEGSRHDVRPDHPRRRRRLHGRHRRRGHGRHVQGTRNVRGAEDGLDQGIRSSRRASWSPPSPA